MEEKINQFWEWLNSASDDNFKSRQGLSPLNDERDYLILMAYENVYLEVIDKFREIVFEEKTEEEPF